MGTKQKLLYAAVHSVGSQIGTILAQVQLISRPFLNRNKGKLILFASFECIDEVLPLQHRPNIAMHSTLVKY